MRTPYIFYTMDNISGSTLIDEQGTLNGSITGATQTDGHINKALNFSGTSTKVDCTPHPGLSDDIAISFFCRFDTVGSDNVYYPLVSISNNANNSGIGLWRTYGAARIHMGKSAYFSGGTGSMRIFQYNDSNYGHTPTTNVWYHYFIQYNHSSGHYEFWVDGTAIFTTEPSTYGSCDGTCNGISIGYGLDAQIDHVKIFNLSSSTPFSQSEIIELRDETGFKGKFEGYVYKESISNPYSNSRVYCYNRSSGDLLAATTSSGNGYYYLETTYSGEHFIIAIDDENNYNLARLDRMIPVEI